MRSKIITFKTHRVSDSLENTAYVIFCYGEPRRCRPQSIPRTPRPREVPPSEVTRRDRREEGGGPARRGEGGERRRKVRRYRVSAMCMMSLRIRSNLETVARATLCTRRERLAVRRVHALIGRAHVCAAYVHVHGALLSPFGEPHQCHREARLVDSAS